MKNRLELHPDLVDCELEDRVLPAAPILMPIPFLPYSSSTNSFVVQGFSSGGSTGGSTLYPGEPSYYLRLGFNLGSAGNGSGNGSGSSGQSTGATFSINGYANSFVSGGTAAQLVSAATNGGGGGGGSSNSNGSSGGNTGDGGLGAGAPGSLGNFSGYGANISSGYGFALNSANNYGMAATTLGSVPVHTFSGGGDMLDAPNQDNPADPYGTNPSAPMTNPETGVGPQGPNAKLYQNLLGKNPGQIGSQPAMPAPHSGP